MVPALQQGQRQQCLQDSPPHPHFQRSQGWSRRFIDEADDLIITRGQFIWSLCIWLVDRIQIVTR